MFEEINANQFLNNLLVLFKKLNTSAWVYLVSLAIAGTSIIFALFKLQSISNLATVNICTQVLKEDKNNSLLNIYVDVAGAVKNPGVYSLEYTQRLASAIEKAGGFSSKADKVFVSQTLNLAKVIEDGEKIYIPFEGEIKNSESKIQNPEFSHLSISVNNGSLEELDSLPGIGEKRAEDIIAGRPYSQIKDLLDKDILTETIYQDIEADISL